MAAITINDLDLNQELDGKALQNILGGRWVYRIYTRRVRRVYWRTYRYVRYRRVRRVYWRTYRYRRRVWV